MRRRVIALCTLAVGSTALIGAPGSASAAAQPAEPGLVYIVQALPDSKVTVAVDGGWRRSGVDASSILGPFELSPGEHRLTVIGRGSNGDWRLKVMLDVTSGRTVDAVLHRPAAPDGRPLVTTFRAPLRAIAGGMGRVLVAHTATAPPADVRLDGEVAFAGVANGEFLTADVPSGPHQAELVPAGASTPSLLGPLPLTVEARTLTSVYAFGRPQDKTMDVIVHQLPLPQRGSAPPDDIDSGSAGLVGGVPVNVSTQSSASAGGSAAAPAGAASPFTLAALVGLLATLALSLRGQLMVRPIHAGRTRPR